MFRRNLFVPALVAGAALSSLPSTASAEEYTNTLTIVFDKIEITYEQLDEAPEVTKQQKKLRRTLRKARRLLAKRIDRATPLIADVRAAKPIDQASPLIAQRAKTAAKLLRFLPELEDEVVIGALDLRVGLATLAQYVQQDAADSVDSVARAAAQQSVVIGKAKLSRVDRALVLIEKARTFAGEAQDDLQAMGADAYAPPPTPLVAHELTHVMQQSAKAAKTAGKAAKRLRISGTLATRIGDRVQLWTNYEGAFFGNLFAFWSPEFGGSVPLQPAQYAGTMEEPYVRPASHLGLATTRSATHVTRTLRFAWLRDRAAQIALEADLTWPTSSDPFSPRGGGLRPERFEVRLLGPYDGPATAKMVDGARLTGLMLEDGELSGRIEVDRQGAYAATWSVDFQIGVITTEADEE